MKSESIRAPFVVGLAALAALSIGVGCASTPKASSVRLRDTVQGVEFRSSSLEPEGFHFLTELAFRVVDEEEATITGYEVRVREAAAPGSEDLSRFEGSLSTSSGVVYLGRIAIPTSAVQPWIHARIETTKGVVEASWPAHGD